MMVLSSLDDNEATPSTIGIKRKKMKRRSRWDVACLGYLLVELPEGIRELIIGKLDLLGYHCFSAVCSSWRSIAFAARQEREKEKLQFSFSSSRPQLPYLMFPSRDEESHQLCFSLSYWKFFKLKLPEFRRGRCVGSSLGWLIITCNVGEKYLLNPASRVQIKLPHLVSQNDIICLNDASNIEAWSWPFSLCFIRKAILFSPPKVAAATNTTTATTTSKNDEAVDCIVVAIYKENCLGFCKPGDLAWTTIKYDHLDVSDFEDIIFYNCQLYAVCRDFDLALLELGSHPRATKCNIPPPASSCPPFRCDDRYIYLLECRGELLMILRHLIFPHYGYVKTIGFQIFKLDSRIPCWVEVESLGDQMLFLGTSRGVSLSAVDYPEFRGNCIFFADDSSFHARDSFGHPGSCCDIGVFSLENESIEHLFQDCYHSSLSPPVWFTPNPW